MVTAPECPDRETWKALLEHALPPSQYERIEQHIDSCVTCQERIDRDASPQDEVLQLARRVGDPSTVPVDLELSQVLERLRGASDFYPESSDEPADLYFLRPSDQEGVLGTLGPYEVQEVIG